MKPIFSSICRCHLLYRIVSRPNQMHSLSKLLCFTLPPMGVALCFEAKAAQKDWPVYGGDFGGTKYSELKQITRENVRRLRPAWIYHCDDARRSPASTIECNPLI